MELIRLLGRLLLVGPVALTLGWNPTPTEAQTVERNIRFIEPAGGGSSLDEFFVRDGYNCGLPRPDSARPAQVARDGRFIEVDIYLVQIPMPCPGLPPGQLVFYPLGRLSEGFYEITRRRHVRNDNSTEYQLSSVATEFIYVGESPNVAASGTWHDPDQPGSGLFLNLLPAQQGGPYDPAFLYILSRLNGNAVWLGGTGEFVDGELRVTLQGPGVPDGIATAVFTYLGCGKARLRVQGDPGLEFRSDDVALSQLTRTAGIGDCKPRGDILPLEWRGG